jgi:hypothetical protein
MAAGVAGLHRQDAAQVQEDSFHAPKTARRQNRDRLICHFPYAPLLAQQMAMRRRLGKMAKEKAAVLPGGSLFSVVCNADQETRMDAASGPFWPWVI